MNLLSQREFGYQATVWQFETISFPISLQLGGVSCCSAVSLPSFDLQHHLQSSLFSTKNHSRVQKGTWCLLKNFVLETL